MRCVFGEYTRACLVIELGASLRSQAVMLILARLIRLYGKPAFVRSHNGGEFTATKVSCRTCAVVWRQAAFEIPEVARATKLDWSMLR
ncbi:hypothetical protein WT00_26180 [Burkholderia territorii]|nr:hypothetical protein WT00_26180 [Burkholderia territorii]